MGQNLKVQVKSVLNNRQTMTLQEKNLEIGVKKNLSSKYIKSIKCIIRGEWNNPKTLKRNTVMTGTNIMNYKICKILFTLFYGKIYLFFNTFS